MMMVRQWALAVRPLAAKQSHFRRPPSRAFAVDLGIVSTIQGGVIALHDALQPINWWATVGLSTVGVRVAMLPLVRYQLKNSLRFSKAVPEMTFLHQLLQERIQSGPVQPNEAIFLIRTYFRGIRSCMKLHEVTLFDILKIPILNATIFVTFVYSLRDLMLNGDPSMGFSTGGAFWFVDMTSKDPTLILPFAAATLTYFNLEVSFSNQQSRVAMFIKDLLQSCLLLAIPYYSMLPAGIFCYWIPSSVWIFVQQAITRNPTVLRKIGVLPELSLPRKP